MVSSQDVRALFAKHDGEHREFARIPVEQRLHVNRHLSAYLKIASLLKAPADFYLCPGHDVIHLTSVTDLREISEEDIIYLRRCSVFYDNESDSLAHFT